MIEIWKKTLQCWGGGAYSRNCGARILGRGTNEEKGREATLSSTSCDSKQTGLKERGDKESRLGDFPAEKISNGQRRMKEGRGGH